ncbi:hypothetical protein JL732_13745 [Listeria welshimeri]|uniref:hypothetical protein n=1 Tax=Listeria welshimeri TaxID=1643 RepID=UPI0016288D96|nr:hypothetical protein [Listeria welshimeri]MBC1409237.1 hypothetical protein [Listeria welshimeri]MBC1971240.1 hypothetical protein [Listeria welshimeri]MBC1991464.1 hypothetical protein [Listeria welshimeri]MBC2006582.1 hypothetical protein [Listeria welshimeri]MBS9367958.1 hypothetical protein [Listeria welshimeri]
MIAEQDNRILSDMAYNVDRKKVDVPLKKGNIIKNKNLSQNYKVIKVKDNSKNGMQAMAVAPIDKHGKVDSTEVIIAYARTNFSDTIVKIVNVITEYIFQIKRNNLLNNSAWLLLIVNI